MSKGNIHNIWVISDNHFFHENIIKYCKRNFISLEYMHNHMINKWNSVVQPEDDIFIIGDFILSYGGTHNYKGIVHKLNGHKKLIRGNHDRQSYTFYKNNGIDFICESFEMKLRQQKVCFIHDPSKLNEKQHGYYDYVFHGHIHHTKVPLNPFRKTNFYNASVDINGYTPRLLNSIIDTMDKELHILKNKIIG